MTKEIIYAINVTLDAYSVIVSIIITASLYIFRKVDKSSKWFAYTNMAAIAYGITDIFTWISEGTDASWKHIGLPLASFLFYVSGIAVFLFYIGYIIRYHKLTPQESKKNFCICSICVLIYMIPLLFTPFTGWYYTITSENTYQRGNFYIFSVLVEIVLYMQALLLIIKYHKNTKGFESIGFASFIFIPFICHVIQILNYGIALSSFGLSISFFLIFINQNRKVHQTMEDSKNEIDKIEYENLKRQRTTILYLTNLIENRDIESTDHEIRLTKYVELLASKCLEANIYPEILTEHFKNMLVAAVPYHDIGKIGIPETILNKPAKFDYAEFQQMQKHVDYSTKIINGILPINQSPEFLKVVLDVCKYHHERWNGRGYPEYLKAEKIPLAARFMAIADAYDAMVTPRCYKEQISYDEAFDIIKMEAGEQFDPLLAEEFLRNKKKIIEITDQYKNNFIEGL